MHSTRPLHRPPSASSRNKLKLSTSSTTATAFKIDDIRNRLRHIQYEPHELVGIRQELISCGILPRTVKSIMRKFKIRVLKTPESIISNKMKQSFVQAIIESGKQQKSAQGHNNSRKQKKETPRLQTPPYITTETITKLETNPSKTHIAQLISYLSNAKICIKDFPRCMIILTRSKINKGKIIATCHKYKHAINMATHLTDEDKSSICKQIENYLQNFKKKTHPPRHDSPSKQIQKINNQLPYQSLTLDQLVKGRAPLKKLGKTTNKTSQITQDYTYKFIASNISQKYNEQSQQSTNLAKIKLSKQTIDTNNSSFSHVITPSQIHTEASVAYMNLKPHHTIQLTEKADMQQSEITRSINETKSTNNLIQPHKQYSTPYIASSTHIEQTTYTATTVNVGNSQITIEDVLNIIDTNTISTEMTSPTHISMSSETFSIEQEPSISDDFLDIFDTKKDTPPFDTNWLSFIQDPDLLCSTTQQPYKQSAHSTELTKHQHLQVEEFYLENIQSGHISPLYLVEAIKSLINTTHPDELLEALSLYEINNLYDPESASERLTSAARLIRAYKDSNKDN